MSILTDHPINQTLAQILAFAEDERRAEREQTLSPELVAGLGRVFTFARLVGDLLERSAPEEVSLNGLAKMQSNLQQAYAELSNFLANGNQAHLVNAISNVDTATNFYTWTFYNRPVRGAKPQFESISQLRQAAEKAIAAIEGRASEVENSVQSANDQLSEQAEKVSALSATMEEIRSSATAAAAAVEQQFDAKLVEFRNDLEALKEGVSKEVDSVKEAFKSEREALLSGFRKDAEQVISDLESQRDKAAQIVQVVGNIGVTGNYQKLAEVERDTANKWRLGAIAFFTLGIGLVVVVLLHNLFGGGESSLEVLVTRFAIAAVVTLPALYAASESARHRRVAESARQTELQLASLNPFLATLPDERRQALIESLAPDYFGRKNDTEDVANTAEHDLPKILDQISNIIAKAKA